MQTRTLQLLSLGVYLCAGTFAFTTCPFPKHGQLGERAVGFQVGEHRTPGTGAQGRSEAPLGLPRLGPARVAKPGLGITHLGPGEPGGDLGGLVWASLPGPPISASSSSCLPLPVPPALGRRTPPSRPASIMLVLAPLGGI